MHTLAKKDANSLSEKQRIFADAVVNGLSRTDACKLAGYSDFQREGTRLMGLAHVRGYVWQEREKLFQGDLATIATNTIRELMTDVECPAHVRFQAAKLSLAIAGHVDKSGKAGKDKDSKEPHEMTPDELDAFIEESRNTIALMEVEVRSVPDDTADETAQADDLQPE